MHLLLSSTPSRCRVWYRRACRYLEGNDLSGMLPADLFAHHPAITGLWVRTLPAVLRGLHAACLPAGWAAQQEAVHRGRAVEAWGGVLKWRAGEAKPLGRRRIAVPMRCYPARQTPASVLQLGNNRLSGTLPGAWGASATKVCGPGQRNCLPFQHSLPCASQHQAA